MDSIATNTNNRRKRVKELVPQLTGVSLIDWTNFQREYRTYELECNNDTTTVRLDRHDLVESGLKDTIRYSIPGALENDSWVLNDKVLLEYMNKLHQSCSKQDSLNSFKKLKMEGDSSIDLAEYVKKWLELEKLILVGTDSNKYNDEVLLNQFCEGLSIFPGLKEDVKNMKFKDLKRTISYSIQLLHENENQWKKLSIFYRHKVIKSKGYVKEDKSSDNMAGDGETCQLCFKNNHPTSQHKCGKCQQLGHSALACTAARGSGTNRAARNDNKDNKSIGTVASNNSKYNDKKTGNSFQGFDKKRKAEGDLSEIDKVKQKAKTEDYKNRACYKCHVPGHLAADCKA